MESNHDRSGVSVRIHEGETVDAVAFKALIGEAVAFNVAKQRSGRS